MGPHDDYTPDRSIFSIPEVSGYAACRCLTGSGQSMLDVFTPTNDYDLITQVYIPSIQYQGVKVGDLNWLPLYQARGLKIVTIQNHNYSYVCIVI